MSLTGYRIVLVSPVGVPSVGVTLLVLVVPVNATRNIAQFKLYCLPDQVMITNVNTTGFLFCLH